MNSGAKKMTRDDLELFATILWTLAPFIVIVAVFFTACIMVAITTIKALKGDFDAPIPKTRRRKTAYGLQLKKPTAMVRLQSAHTRILHSLRRSEPARAQAGEPTNV